MNIAIWCVVLAGLLPVLTVAIAKGKSGYNNYSPRSWLDKQEGFRKRADYAHRNHFEAFPFFAAGVLFAWVAKVPPELINPLAIGFVVTRIVYTVLYLTNHAWLRSAVWFAGMACVLALFFRAAQAVG